MKFEIGLRMNPAEEIAVIDAPFEQRTSLGPDPEIVSASDVLEFHAYWLRIRGDRPIPSRVDFDPADIVHFLPGVLLLNVLDDPLDFEYRIVGENVRSWLGNGKGRRVRHAALADLSGVQGSAYDSYRWVFHNGRPQFFEGLTKIGPCSDRRTLVSRVHCPLSSGAQVTHIVSYIAFRNRPATKRMI